MTVTASLSNNSGQRARATLAKLLMSKIMVNLVTPLTRNRIRHLGVTIYPDLQVIGPYTRAELFWGIFERTECKFIMRHLAGATCVLELGSGIGATSTHIASVLTRGGTLVCVDANPTFAPMIERNIGPHVLGSRLDATVRSVAIAPNDGGSVLMLASNPFMSRVGVAAEAPIVAHIPVEARSLRSLIEEHGLAAIDLVCDVEGAEGEFIMREGRTGLESCRRVIIELHHCRVGGASYSPDDLLAVLRTRWGFHVLERKGPVVALDRRAVLPSSKPMALESWDEDLRN